MPVMLSVSGAYKNYGSTKALDGAAMSLKRGECLALLGPNGAGKTTLIRAITGRVRLDQGTTTLLGQALEPGPQNSALRKVLGFVPQDIALYPLLTARENLRAFGEINGVRGEDLRARIDWALDWTGLNERADSQTRTFSGGMKRRLNIACAVLHNPEVVLLDEPTVGVDPQSRQRIWEMLAALRGQGASLLLTTHQLDEAQQMCDRITIIDHGKTIADGSFDQLLAQTVGTSRRVLLKLKNDAARKVSSEYDIIDSETIGRRVHDIVNELPGFLSELNHSGVEVVDLRVETPTLQSVFIHLTGRELRE
jgi:ABC-2 type transport system ATP-binding protein